MTNFIQEEGPFLSWYIQEGQTQDTLRLGEDPNVTHLIAYHQGFFNLIKTINRDLILFNAKEKTLSIDKEEYCKALYEYINPENLGTKATLEKIKETVDKQLCTQSEPANLTTFSNQIVQQMAPKPLPKERPPKALEHLYALEFDNNDFLLKAEGVFFEPITPLDSQNPTSNPFPIEITRKKNFSKALFSSLEENRTEN